MSNSWKSDPLSEGYPGNAIGGRYDFKGGPFPGTHDGWFSLGLDGAHDAKIVSAVGTQKMTSVMAINGPPHGDDCCPPFEWTGRWANQTHIGMPEKFAFKWENFVVLSDGTIAH